MHRLSLIAALCAAASPAATRAAEADDEIIVTATGASAARHEIGQSISVLTETDIARLQSTSVADLLVRVPGITMTRNGPTGGFAAVRIRGAEGEQTLALIDGIKVNDPSSPGGGFDFGTLLTGNIARIEVLRGPNSVPWGSEAIGGVVNILTPSPEAPGWQGSANAEAGAGQRQHLVANLASGSGPVRLSLGGSWFDEDLISAFRQGAEKDGLRQYAGTARIAADLTPDISLDVRGWYAHSRIDQDGYAPPDYMTFMDTAEVTRVAQAIGYAGVNAQTGAIKNRVAVTLSDINRDNFAAPGDAAPQYLNRGRITRFEYRGDWRMISGLRALFGAEHERDQSFDGYTSARTHVTSVYLQAIANPLPRLTLTSGIRLDDHASFGSHWTPATHLAWQTTPTTRLRAAYGAGFKAPSLFQLYGYYGNRALQPETADSLELGVDQQWAEGRVALSASYFRRKIKNQIDFISCAGRTTGICTDRPDGTYDNRIATRAQGLELSGTAHLTPRLSLQASYGWLKAIDLGTGERLPRRPRHQFSADLDWQAPIGLQLGASLGWTSARPDTDYASYASVMLPGYRLVSLRAAMPLAAGLELFGRVENLFDTPYQLVSGYGTPGRAAYAGVRSRF
ncbi:MAG: TonB-dependent receptor plug domain-containing protein [Chakrabartia sp.]